jgi:hypothetical protein
MILLNKLPGPSPAQNIKPKPKVFKPDPVLHSKAVKSKKIVNRGLEFFREFNFATPPLKGHLLKTQLSCRTVEDGRYFTPNQNRSEPGSSERAGSQNCGFAQK